MVSVAYLGNMNNNAFACVRYLRDRGFDAHAFRFPLESTVSHFHPSADTYDDSFTAYVHDLEWGNSYDIYKYDRSEIRAALAKYDVVIGSGTAPAYMDYIGRPLDIFIPYGEDILFMPHRWTAKPQNLMARLRLIYHQRRGIRAARHFVMDAADPQFERALLSLKPRGIWHKTTPPFLYLPQYLPGQIEKNYGGSKLYPAFRKIREENDIVIFHHCRHHWKPSRDLPEWLIKDNYKVLEGMRQFMDRHPDRKVKLVTFEYGRDVQASKDLAESLDIAGNVAWFPVSPRHEIMIGISQSDFGVGELHDSWFSYGVMIEILTAAKPFIGRRDEGAFGDKELYPMVSIKNSAEFAAAMEDFDSNRDAWSRMGLDANAWLQQEIEKTVTLLSDIITETATAKPSAAV